ncbi:rhodanese-like domain-containing protein [Candidatus Parcubacteria bacterium]|nr:rhodanese-like domain-containing protein [Candidatus Parcubacteria bacterium]
MENQILKNISPEEFKEKLNSNEYVLIDARTQEEHNEEKIADSEVMDVTKPDFTEKINSLDKDKKYLVYCKGGVRSGQTMSEMGKMGFKEVLNLEGGIDGYQKFIKL